MLTYHQFPNKCEWMLFRWIKSGCSVISVEDINNLSETEKNLSHKFKVKQYQKVISLHFSQTLGSVDQKHQAK